MAAIHGELTQHSNHHRPKEQQTMKTLHHTPDHTAAAAESTIEAGDNTPKQPTTQPEKPRCHEPIWRVVGVSLASGLIGALVLTFGVFAGAGEHVISGTALCAFAGGWALLAVLSGRFTSRPQRWSHVPAGVMAVAGLTLLVARPDDHALDTAGWVWPPVAVALALWVFLQVRRGFDGRVRWLLYPVVASLGIGAIGAMYETAMRAHDRSAYPAPGTLYDVGGHRLHLYCTGAGSPTVVLEGGLGGTSPGWARITSDVNRTTRVCAYDRAGQGWSDDVDRPQDGLAIAADLHALLAQANETGPYVLVGHSAGGPYVMNFAARYPNQVAGVVLLDSMSPYEFTELAGFANEQSMMHRGLGVLPSLARIGAARVVPTPAWSNLPEPAASQVQAFASAARGMRAMRDEQSIYPTVFEQAKALTSLDGKPLIVVTATESVQQHTQWLDLQGRLAALSTNSDQRVADATHAGLLDDAASYQSSVLAINDVIRSVRTDQPVIAR
jgi:pimeloyl-ACP methyl ester carboxylesterase